MNSDNNTNNSLYMDNGMSDANAQLYYDQQKNCIIITKCIEFSLLYIEALQYRKNS